MTISLMKHQPRKPPVSAASSDSSDPLDSIDLATRIERRTSALTTPELADVVHLSPKKIYALAAKRLIPSYRIRGSIRFDPHRVAEWLRSQAA
jgi:excisionase family DNA binding protein